MRHWEIIQKIIQLGKLFKHEFNHLVMLMDAVEDNNGDDHDHDHNNNYVDDDDNNNIGYYCKIFYMLNNQFEAYKQR